MRTISLTACDGGAEIAMRHALFGWRTYLATAGFCLELVACGRGPVAKASPTKGFSPSVAGVPTPGLTVNLTQTTCGTFGSASSATGVLPRAALVSATQGETAVAGSTEAMAGSPAVQPSVWDIADTMMKDCVPFTGTGIYPSDPIFEAIFNFALRDQPQLQDTAIWLPSYGVESLSDIANSQNAAESSPFADLNSPPVSNPGPFPPGRLCAHMLFFQNLPENQDGDRTLVGEAYLFYVTSGTPPEYLEAAVKEVHFAFSPAQ